VEHRWVIATSPSLFLPASHPLFIGDNRTSEARGEMGKSKNIEETGARLLCKALWNYRPVDTGYHL
jgi:hypothetical protein